MILPTRLISPLRSIWGRPFRLPEVPPGFDLVGAVGVAMFARESGDRGSIGLAAAKVVFEQRRFGGFDGADDEICESGTLGRKRHCCEPTLKAIEHQFFGVFAGPETGVGAVGHAPIIPILPRIQAGLWLASAVNLRREKR